MHDSGLGEFLVMMALLGYIWLMERRRKKSPAAGTAERSKKSTYHKYNMNWREIKDG